MGQNMFRTSFICGAALAVMASVSTVDAATIVAEPAGAVFTSSLEARWRNLDGSADQGAMYLGTPDVGVGVNRVETTAGQTLNLGQSYSFSLSWDTSDNVAIMTLGARTLQLDFDAPPAGKTGIADPGLFDDLRIEVRTVSGGTLTLTDLTLAIDGGAAAAVAGSPISRTGNGSNFFSINNLGFTDSFVIAGNFVATDARGNNEATRFTVFGGDYAAVPAPAAFGLLALGFIGLGIARRRMA